MKKSYALFYINDNFKHNVNGIFEPASTVNPLNAKYKKVYDYLDTLRVKPREEIILNLIDYARNS